MKKSPLAELPGGILRVRPNAGSTGNGKHSARKQPFVPIPPINRNPFIVRKFGKVLVRKGCFFFRESGMIVLANGTMQWSLIRDFTNSLSLFCTICLFPFLPLIHAPPHPLRPARHLPLKGKALPAAKNGKALPPQSAYGSKHCKIQTIST